MECRWEGFFHLGVVYPKLFAHANSGQGPILETLSKLLQDPFFSAVEVTWIKDDDVRRQARDLLQISGMAVLFNGAPAIRELQINLCALDSELRQTSVERLKKVIDEAYFLGAKILHCVSGPDPGPAQRPEATRGLIDSLEQLCRYALENATDYTLVLALENSDREVDRLAMLGPTVETVDVVRAVRRQFSNCGILLDQGHFPLMKEDPEQALEMARGLLTHVHIGNCYSKDRTKPYFGDKHLPFGVPGSDVGVAELAAFIRKLREIGFWGQKSDATLPVISFEAGPYMDEPPEVVVANLKRYFTRAWALV
jgi:sugar phosphate isomerase/epimerase